MANSATAFLYKFFFKGAPCSTKEQYNDVKNEAFEDKDTIVFTFSFIFFCGKTSEQSATDNMNAGVVRNGSKSVAKNRTSTKMKVTLKIEEQEEMKPIKNNPELKEG